MRIFFYFSLLNDKASTELPVENENVEVSTIRFLLNYKF